MDHAQKVEIVHRYVAAYNSADLEKMLGLFSPKASMEDPVGAPPAEGIEAIAALYRIGFDMGIELELDGVIRSAGGAVAFPVCASTTASKLYIIDVFEFDESNRILRMRAYWSRDNLIGEMDI